MRRCLYRYRMDHLSCSKEGEETGKELVVWAWSTQPGMCAEGVTWIVQSRTENSDLVTRRDFDVRDIINMNQKV